MTVARMSPAALARCRYMVVTPEGDTGSTKIQVQDPKFAMKVVASQTVRTTVDLNRYVLAWRKSYHIPDENITRNDLVQETSESEEEDND